MPDYVPRIAITMGDPAGIGPEMVVKSLAKSEIYEDCIPIVLGDKGVLQKVRRDVGGLVRCVAVNSPEEAKPNQANLISLSNINLDNFRFGESRIDWGLISTFYIVKAAEFAVSRRVDALVTCPINKAMLTQAGFDHNSHSEFLKAYTKAEHAPVMMVGEHVRITRVTSHYPIRQVADLITPERVQAAIQLTHQALKAYPGIANPHLAVCGLNPHAGEGGLFGREEEQVIIPAIEKGRSAGFRITGPLAADVAFSRARDGQYDAVICMYHDQGQIAFRLIDFGFGVNITLGLPIIRTAPDHGTAYDIAGKGLASEHSMVRAIQVAARLARQRELQRQAAATSTPVPPAP